MMTNPFVSLFFATCLLLFSNILLANDEVVIQILSDEMFEKSGTGEMEDLFKTDEYGFKVKSVSFAQIRQIKSLIEPTDTLVGIVIHGHGTSSTFNTGLTKEQSQLLDLPRFVSGEQLAHFIFKYLPVEHINKEFFVHHFSCSNAGYCKTGDNFQDVFLKSLAQLFTSDGYTEMSLKSFAFFHTTQDFVHKMPDQLKNSSGFLNNFRKSTLSESEQEKSLHNWWTRNLKWSFYNKKSIFTYIALGYLIYMVEPSLLALYVQGLAPLHLTAARNETLVGSHARMVSIKNNEFKTSPKATIKSLLRENLSKKVRSCNSF